MEVRQPGWAGPDHGQQAEEFIPPCWTLGNQPTQDLGPGQGEVCFRLEGRQRWNCSKQPGRTQPMPAFFLT